MMTELQQWRILCSGVASRSQRFFDLAGLCKKLILKAPLRFSKFCTEFLQVGALPGRKAEAPRRLRDLCPLPYDESAAEAAEGMDKDAALKKVQLHVYIIIYD